MKELLCRFVNLTTMIESQIVGQNSRDNIDAAYEKMVRITFSRRLMQYEVLCNRQYTTKCIAACGTIVKYLNFVPSNIHARYPFKISKFVVNVSVYFALVC